VRKGSHEGGGKRGVGGTKKAQGSRNRVEREDSEVVKYAKGATREKDVGKMGGQADK